MKKLLIACLIAIPVTAYGASYTLTDANVTLKANGTDVWCLPMALHGTTYLPIRDVAEALGAEVKYNNATKQIDINTFDANKLAESCVMLQVSGGQGSGVYIDYGTILTCDHVTRGMTEYKTSDGLKLVLQKGNKDIDASTLISTNTSIKPVKIGDSDELKQDDKVVLVTSPNKTKNKVTYGMMMENCTADKIEVKVWADVDHGSSGGAVFNMKGELVGIMRTAADKTTESGSCCTMVPINEIRKNL